VRKLLLPALLLLLVLPAGGPAAAQEGEGIFFECADFTPESVRQACVAAVPTACRGVQFAEDDGFSECLEENGASQAEVNAAIEAAQRSAGVMPAGGVDAGLGGLVRPTGDDGGPPWLAVVVLALGAAILVRRARAR